MDQLDRLLADGAPPTTTDDPGVRSSLAAMSTAAAAAAAAGRVLAPGPLRPARRRIATAVVAASLGLAGAGVAAATGGWWGGQGTPELVLQDLDGREDCLAGFRIAPEEGTSDDDPVLAAARTALAQVDAADLDLHATERSMADEGLLPEDTPAGERWDRVLMTAVHRHVEATLAAQGLDPATAPWGLLGRSDCVGTWE